MIDRDALVAPPTGRTRRGRPMRCGALGIAVALACLGSGVDDKATRKGDPPHWASPSGSVNIDCSTQCHTGHNAAGGTLTQSASNVNLCQTCHNPNAGATAQALPISNADMAVPGVSGSSHGFDVAPVNATLGTRMPTNVEMSLRMPDGRIVCSTCHNQHASDPFLDAGNEPRGGTPRVSPTQKTTTLGSTGAVVSGGTFTGTQGLWYRLDIAAAGSETTARFRYSKDNGLTWTPNASCTPGGVVTGCLTASTTATLLDNGVTVAFGPGSYNLGERWELSAAFPLLRAPLDDVASASAFCSDCHFTWTMSFGSVETYDGNFKSHPVGIALGANAHGYDRAIPLDANGGAQGVTSDAYPANDLRLDNGGNVQCFTCHAPHFAPGNSAAVVP